MQYNNKTQLIKKCNTKKNCDQWRMHGLHRVQVHPQNELSLFYVA